MKDLKERICSRSKDSHKYDFGHLLVVGGSSLYSGSPAFNTLAAYRSGVDLVTTAAPLRAANLSASFSPSVIAYPLEGDYLNKSHVHELEGVMGKVDAAVIGGGLGREEDTEEAVLGFLEKFDRPAAIDADAIHAVAENKDVLRSNHALTPHAQEFEVLTGAKATEENVIKYAKELGCVILLKGRRDIISNGEETMENKTGNEYMTVGGTGDSLAGVVGSLLAQGFGPKEAAHGGAWINGRAGDVAAEEKGAGLMTEDIIEKIPEALKG